VRVVGRKDSAAAARRWQSKPFCHAPQNGLFATLSLPLRSGFSRCVLNPTAASAREIRPLLRLQMLARLWWFVSFGAGVLLCDRLSSRLQDADWNAVTLEEWVALALLALHGWWYWRLFVRRRAAQGH